MKGKLGMVFASMEESRGLKREQRCTDGPLARSHERMNLTRRGKEDTYTTTGRGRKMEEEE